MYVHTSTLVPADSDFRGSLQALLESRENKPLVLERGTSWFQLVVVKAHLSGLTRVDKIQVDTARGLGSFGSTGFAGEQPSSLKRVRSGSDTDNSGDGDKVSGKKQRQEPTAAAGSPAAAAAEPTHHEEESVETIPTPAATSAPGPE